jgi:hypothetical protein
MVGAQGIEPGTSGPRRGSRIKSTLDKSRCTRQSWLMPDSRLPGLATVAVLMFVGMLAAAITVTGPIPVPYEVAKDFQPLIAALVAIISAGIVLYGATLAYRASMAKVALDREIHEKEVRRRQRGVLLRARFDAFAMSQSAIEIRKRTRGPMPYDLNVSEVILLGRSGIDDAWNKLEDFPGKISRAFSALKAEILNLEMTTSEFEGKNIVTVAYNSKEARSVKDLVEHLTAIERHCDVIFRALEEEIADR